MLRSMYSGVSGLRNHQIRLDVIGNNIANVNTIGFKSSRVTFKDVLSQTLRAATRSQSGRGGMNPVQVGLGMSIASIDTNHTQGSMQSTGKTTDLGVDGNGFFVLRAGNRTVFARGGNFDLDENGFLVVPGTGMKVQGWVNGQVSDLVISNAATYSAEPTSTVRFANNLDSNAATGTIFGTTVDVYDSLGTLHTVDITFTRTAAGWGWTSVPAGSGSLTFDTSGNLATGSPGTIVPFVTGTGSADLGFDLNFSEVTCTAGETTLAAASRDGAPMGSLKSYSIDTSGNVIGEFSNGMLRSIGQIALAKFANPSGLQKSGDTTFIESNNSGMPQIGRAGTAGFGDITPGALEMSNVDLSQEFTDMIVTQRGLQANSRIITTSDEVLQELVNMKR